MRKGLNQRVCNSSLTSEYYQKLLELLNTAIAAGDLSGGSAFDKTALLNLEQQAQSFASLPTATAGVRVMDDSFNYPLSLLLARLKALAGEADNFVNVSGRLLDILQHETDLVPSSPRTTYLRAREGPGPRRISWRLSIYGRCVSFGLCFRYLP